MRHFTYASTRMFFFSAVMKRSGSGVPDLAFRDASGKAAEQAQTMMPDLGAMGDLGDLGF